MTRFVFRISFQFESKTKRFSFFYFFKDTVSELVSRILAGPQSSPLLYGSSVIVELIRQSSSELFDFETPLEDLPSIIRVVTQNASKLNEYLLVSPEEKIQTTFGTLSPPLGTHRLKVVELFGMLVNARYVSVYIALLDTPALSTLIVSKQ